MEKLAFVNGNLYVYWSSIILGAAVLTAIAAFAALYLRKSGNSLALSLMIPLAFGSSLVLARLIHWYCLADGYESMTAAVTDYSWGGYALMGVFIACLICACVLRLARVVTNLPEMLDCMALAGGLGIAVGRMASLFNSSDRGMLVSDKLGLPFAYPVTNAVSGMVENRLATFMIQGIITLMIVVALFAMLAGSKARKRPVKDGDVCLLFLASYGASQILLDSTRYDSLFMRSNGFISIVQILGAVALVTAIVIFSVRMVKARGMRPWFVGIWLGILAALGGAGYMEYHVQRHGDQALFAYSVMGVCMVAAVAATVLIRHVGLEQRDV